MLRIIIVGLVLLSVGSAWAVDKQPNTISLHLNDVDVSEALTQLSQQAQVSIMGDASVKGRVSCSLNDVTPEQALNTICSMNGLVWVRAYISTETEERPRASALFALIDSLAELGGVGLIWQDPQTDSRTVYLPGTSDDALDVSGIASHLKMRPIYLIRARPVPVAETEEQPDEAAPALPDAPPQDPSAAADQVWNYFNRMPMDQQFQVFRELGRMFMENVAPEQRDWMRRMGESWRRRGDAEGHPPYWQGEAPSTWADLPPFVGLPPPQPSP